MTAQHPDSAELRDLALGLHLEKRKRSEASIACEKAANALDAMQAEKEQCEEYACLLIKEKQDLQARCDALHSIVERWGALDGGMWHLARYRREREELLSATNDALAAERAHREGGS